MIICLNQTSFTSNELVERGSVAWPISCVSSRTACLSLSGRKWRYPVHSRKELGLRLMPCQHRNGYHLRITWRTLLVPSLNGIFLIFPYIFLLVIFLHCETICDVTIFFNKNLKISGTREDNQKIKKNKRRKRKRRIGK